MIRFSVPDENSRGLFSRLKAMAKARINNLKTVSEHVEESYEELQPFEEISQQIFSQFVKHVNKTNLEPDIRMSDSLDFLEEEVLNSQGHDSLMIQENSDSESIV